MDKLALEVAKDVQALKMKENLSIEAALKKIAIEYSRGMRDVKSEVDKDCN